MVSRLVEKVRRSGCEQGGRGGLHDGLLSSVGVKVGLKPNEQGGRGAWIQG